MSQQASRRAFLRHAAALGSLGAAAPLGMSLSMLGHASAQAAQGDYKALVCVFLYGGNDAFNCVIPTDSDSWTHYVNQRDPMARGTAGSGTSIALLPAGTASNALADAGTPARLGGVLPIGHSGRAAHANRQFAMHPLLSDVRNMHQAGRVAVLANVGPLKRRLTKAEYFGVTVPRPAKLFSHNDQQSTWQSFAPEGADNGWGGRMGDLLMSGNATGLGSYASLAQRSFTCISPGSSGIWLSGAQVQSLQAGATGLLDLGSSGRVLDSIPLRTAIAEMMTASPSDNLLWSDHQAVAQRGLAIQSLIGPLLPPLSSTNGSTPWSSNANPWVDPVLSYNSPITGAARFNQLALQFQMVARLIDANRAGNLGMKRQVFMVSLGGFDTHSIQNQEHSERLAQLNHALAYFDRVLGQMPGGDMRSQVTTFTASEFGRNLANNGDGTDHGWGSHHLIMGGAVNGTEVYGTYPQLATGNANNEYDSPDLLQNGAMLPSTSVDQYAYTLGKWMGLSAGDLTGIMPNLGNFDASTHDLGFMSA
ncbi:MAG TPA: DUF1501 domain-containing protein [Candidatus Aquabacterium excrementipullorum]|nr:DUF1501 domain-containing protein [Candidatus Aquabacterium excrementipullorum]